MLLLDGKVLANEFKAELKDIVEEEKDNGVEFKLCIISVGGDEACSTYVKNKIKACEYIGIKPLYMPLPEETTQEQLIDFINMYNFDDDVTGIIVQLPLPKHIDEHEIAINIDPLKDVDGFNPINVGNMYLGNDAICPCTPRGIMYLLNYYHIDVEGKECVVVGRSNIVGKPMAMELLEANGTVTICHSKTKNLKEICKRADILVCAIGQPKFFNEEYVKDGAVVIDVGIHRVDNKLCGDVDFDAVKDKVYAITPVPGGVGPMTVASLMDNVVYSAMEQYGE